MIWLLVILLAAVAAFGLLLFLAYCEHDNRRGGYVTDLPKRRRP